MVFGTLGRECQHTVALSGRPQAVGSSVRVLVAPEGSPAEAPSERPDDQVRRSRLPVAFWRKCDTGPEARSRGRLRLHVHVRMKYDLDCAALVQSSGAVSAALLDDAIGLPAGSQALRTAVIELDEDL